MVCFAATIYVSASAKGGEGTANGKMERKQKQGSQNLGFYIPKFGFGLTKFLLLTVAVYEFTQPRTVPLHAF